MSSEDIDKAIANTLTEIVKKSVSIEALDALGEIDPTVELTIEIRGKEVIFIVKPFTTVREMERLGAMSKRALAIATAGAPPWTGKSEAEINTVNTLLIALVEPKLTQQQLIKYCDMFGPAMMKLSGDILKLSGITDKVINEEEEKLRKDPFQTDDIDDGAGVSTSTS